VQFAVCAVHLDIDAEGFRMRVTRLAVVFALFGLSSGCEAAEPYGKFIGDVQTQWLDDGRRMKLLSSLTYLDPQGERWIAPEGSVVDGASIPQFAWSVIGGPFEGKYRKASVIHDVACVEKRRPWELVHETFYQGMRASGVNETRAKIMYAAVYHFGPRWVTQYDLKQVPREAVDDTVNRVKAQADKDAVVQVSIARKYTVTPPGAAAAKVEVSDLQVTVVPPAGALKQSDLAELNAKIDKQAMTLKEIRDHRPMPPMNLRIQ
jgi:hypothetical protein